MKMNRLGRSWVVVDLVELVQNSSANNPVVYYTVYYTYDTYGRDWVGQLTNRTVPKRIRQSSLFFYSLLACQPPCYIPSLIGGSFLIGGNRNINNGISNVLHRSAGIALIIRSCWYRSCFPSNFALVRQSTHLPPWQTLEGIKQNIIIVGKFQGSKKL